MTGYNDAGVGEHRDESPPTATSALILAWVGFALKNLIGWALIVASFVIGPMIPGPGGIPVFLLGFALITFPGKRKATARVLRGIPVDPCTATYRVAAVAVAMLLPAAVIVYIQMQWGLWDWGTNELAIGTFACYLAAAGLLLKLAWNGRVLNWLIRRVPTIRRRVRPWMNDHGIRLLPPRRRRRYVTVATVTAFESMDETILKLDERHVTRMQKWTAVAKRWGRKLFGVVVTVAIFVWILKPIVANWDRIDDRISEMNWGRVALGSVLFAAYLFVFRALVWRRLLKNFGHKLPIWPITRIWSTSELARYLPGSVWQVVGRVYLIKPYGVRGSVCSTSQIMELALYLLANLIVALGALTFLGWKSFEGAARNWMIVAAILVPLLSLALHPKVFYAIADKILVALKKPPIQKRMRWKSLIDLLLWNVLGLTVQGLAIYLVVAELLQLPLTKWWVVTGAYCLAWCAGFLAFWAPGGLGVREAVFIAAMSFAIPHAVRSGQLQDPEQRLLFLIFLSVLLRIWATVGELILTATAYLLDWRGATRPRGTPVVITQTTDAATALPKPSAAVSSVNPD